ncbi:MAG: hypothetical protein ACLRWQ_20680 [Flavonifractor plautii]
MKDRIRRALKWKPAAPWMAAVLFVLAVALGLLSCSMTHPSPDPTVNGQYPTLRIQMEQDGPGGAGGETVVDMGVPEAATWPEELPEAERTASTPRPWVSLYLDNGAFPSRWTMTEYSVWRTDRLSGPEVGLSPYGAGNGWLLRLESREDAPGAGMETRLYVLSLHTWQEGIRTHELEYAFRLNLPSVPPGPLTDPVVVAGDTRVDLDGDASATAAMGSFLHITIPDNVVSYALAGQGADGGSTGQGGESLSSGGGGSIGVRLEYLGGRAPGASSDQTQHYTPTYTWADGTPRACHRSTPIPPRPRDDEGLRIRYPGDTSGRELIDLDPRARRVGRTGLGGPGRGGEPRGSSERHRRHERRPQRLVRVRHRPRRRGRGYLRLPHPRRGAHLAGDWAARPGPDDVVPLLHLFHRQLHWLPGSELFQRRAHLPHH